MFNRLSNSRYEFPSGGWENVKKKRKGKKKREKETTRIDVVVTWKSRESRRNPVLNNHSFRISVSSLRLLALLHSFHTFHSFPILHFHHSSVSSDSTRAEGEGRRRGRKGGEETRVSFHVLICWTRIKKGKKKKTNRARSSRLASLPLDIR